MEKFLKKTPQASTSGRVASKRKYEECGRKRLYLKSWGDQYSWLLYSANDNKMFCKPCRAVYGPLAVPLKKKGLHNDKFTKLSKGPLVVGSSNFRKHALDVHSESDGHIDAIRRNIAKNPAIELPADKCLMSLNKADLDRITLLFRNAHAVAVKCKSFKDFVWMCELDDIKGHNVGKKTYRNDKKCREFVATIAQEQRNQMTNLLKDVLFVTVLSDGSVDVAVIENEAVYIRSCYHGKVNTFFVNMAKVPRANSEGIVKAIRKSLRYVDANQYDDTLMKLEDKLICFTGDGASVNSGQHNGVIALLQKQLSKEIIFIHCLNHRLELAFKKAMKNFKLYEKVNTLLAELFKFYHTSALQSENLKTAFLASNVPPIQPQRVGGTRWVSHLNGALSQLWRGYKVFVQHLDQVAIDNRSPKQPKAKCLLKLLTAKDVVTFACHIHDVIEVITHLSMEIQKDSAAIYRCHEQISSTITTMQTLKERPGPHLRTMIDVTELQGVLLKGNLPNNFEEVKSNVLSSVIQSLEDRCSNVFEGILQACKLADFSTWPAECNESFGVDFVSTLSDHFKETLEKHGINPSSTEVEWIDLRTALYNNHKIHELNWEVINERYQPCCPNVLALIDIILTLPASSSICERGFSQMKLTKTDRRNRMHSMTLTDLLTVKLHAPESPSKKHKKHKKHKHKKHERSQTEEDSVDEEIKVKQEDKPGIKLKIKIGGETLGNSGELASTPGSDKKKKKDKSGQSSTTWKAKDDVFRTKKSDEDTSDEEKEWLNALEKGTLDDKGMIKKTKDENLMTARQRALLHGKQSEPLMELPTGYKSKGELSEEQIKKKQQRAKQRKEMAVQKHEKDKKQTLERLLKKQDAKNKSVKSRQSKRSRPPGFRYINSPSGISISVPEGKSLPFTSQKAPKPPVAIHCGVAGCQNLKKYNCSKTEVPLCSLDCYKKNLNQNKHLITMNL